MLPSIILAIALSLPFSVAAAPPRRDETLHIPLIRRRTNVRRDDMVDLNHYLAVSDRLRKKYGFKQSSPSRRAQTTSIGITNQGDDTSYFAQVSVGTPAQTFNLVLDTGSSDLWFASSGCAGCSSNTPVLNPQSSSLQLGTQRISLDYGSGSASGVIARDTVTLGPFTVNPQTFVAVDDLSSGLIDGELSGIMGLAFVGIANSQALPFWQALVNNNQLTNPEFSFFITRFDNNPNAKTEEPGGVLTFGGTNSSLFQGDVDFQPFTLSGAGTFWLQTVSGVIVNGNTVNTGTGNSAAIDTGTTLIGAPTAAVNAIWGAVNGAVPLSGNMSGFYTFPCNTQLSIAISFGGPAWPINPADLNAGQVSNGRCLGAIFDITAGSNVKPNTDTPDWIVGDTFLKNVYSVFRSNPPAVGFAQLSSGSSGAPSTTVGTPKTTSGSSPSSSALRLTLPLGATGITLTCALSLLTSAYILLA
ncbi:aspartic peptidase domain-containing protein [Russula aff. rugulosa BPL654]|nr:aspartic peptidase domain-containing protein [Russula aff. rugulosa BPL654]